MDRRRRENRHTETVGQTYGDGDGRTKTARRGQTETTGRTDGDGRTDGRRRSDGSETVICSAATGAGVALLVARVYPESGQSNPEAAPDCSQRGRRAGKAPLGAKERRRAGP